jgi:hypothetical protein
MSYIQNESDGYAVCDSPSPLYISLKMGGSKSCWRDGSIPYRIFTRLGRDAPDRLWIQSFTTLPPFTNFKTSFIKFLPMQRKEAKLSLVLTLLITDQSLLKVSN